MSVVVKVARPRRESVPPDRVVQAIVGVRPIHGDSDVDYIGTEGSNLED
jgi:hypothetical protein